jgi:hypothetical protein
MDTSYQTARVDMVKDYKPSLTEEEQFAAAYHLPTHQQTEAYKIQADQESTSLPCACNELYFKLIHLLRCKPARFQVLNILTTIIPFVKLYIENVIHSNKSSKEDVALDTVEYYFRAALNQLQPLQEPLNTPEEVFRMQILAFTFDIIDLFQDLLPVS